MLRRYLHNAMREVSKHRDAVKALCVVFYVRFELRLISARVGVAVIGPSAKRIGLNLHNISRGGTRIAHGGRNYEAFLSGWLVRQYA